MRFSAARLQPSLGAESLNERKSGHCLGRSYVKALVMHSSVKDLDLFGPQLSDYTALIILVPRHLDHGLLPPREYPDSFQTVYIEEQSDQSWPVKMSE
jgi:hypothetical protein